MANTAIQPNGNPQRPEIPSDTLSDLVALERWLQELDKTPTTAWRWRKKGWITTINIAGRLYISRECIKEFERRAAAGEFSQIHKTPGNSRP